MSNDAEKKEERRCEVAIFGAGIAGLTAAHELIERGFRVEIFEMAKPSVWDQLSGAPCAIGGMAQTQWSRAERPDPRKRTYMNATEPIVDWPRETIEFAHDSATLTPEGERTIEKFAKCLRKKLYVKHLEVRGFTDDPSAEPYPDKPGERIDFQRAKKVVDYLKKLKNPPKTHKIEPAALGFGYRDDWTVPNAKRNYVDFHVIEDLIPGEHGFRFFPSFYRNLFDTMRRTPVADDEQAVYHETGKTVLDNLVRTKTQRVSFEDPQKGFDFPRQPVTSLEQLFDQLASAMKGIGCTLSDIARFHLKLFKYMTSCPERRAAEYETQSWWDFIGGDQYSERCRHYIESTGQLLVANRASESDARSHGTSSVQLVLDQVVQNAQIVDGTLSGPTSLAWFDHWRRYLERQGVEFHRGKLKRFEILDAHTVWPVVRVYENAEMKDAKDRSNNQDEKDEGVQRVLVRDYCVIALDVGSVQGLVRDALTKLSELNHDDFKRINELKLGTTSQARPDGALQHMSGIQYYFESDIRFVEGHTDYADSPWGLSSISQPQFWTRRRGWWSGYRGVLSVDICDWFTPSPTTQKAAWDSNKHEIAKEVWNQITTTIPKTDDGTFPRPILYHLDTNIVFPKDGGGKETPQSNATPYLVNRVGEYSSRPGTPGDYKLSCKSLVFAGTYMQTHTRITTMEAANESGRHAVNAILKDCGFSGERCEIFNPEACEPADLKFLVELDRRLLKLGLPHFSDIVDLRALPKALLRPDADLGAIGVGNENRPQMALLRAITG